MADNNEIIEQSNSVSQQENLDDTNQYIEAIREMKQNSVSKEAYNKLREENKQLLDAFINGKQITIEQSKQPVDVSLLRKKLSDIDNPMSNLEYAKTAVELRDALIDQGEMDPFLPIGHQITPTDEDITKAEKVATVLRECIDYADGDSELFTNELQRRMIDSMPIRKTNTRR